MLFDEKKYRLDQRAARILEDDGAAEFMQKTRSDLLRQIQDDIERARKASHQPDLRLTDMSKMLKGDDVRIRTDEKFLVPYPTETGMSGIMEDESAMRDKIRLDQEKLARFDVQAAFLGLQKAYFATSEEIEEWEDKKNDEDQRRLDHYKKMNEILPKNEFL